MLQRYHVLIRRPGGCVIVDRRPFGWLLPIVTADARSRAPHVISRFLEHLHIDGAVACVTSGIVDPHRTGVDWLAVVDARTTSRSDILRESAVSDLLENPAVVQVQCDLLRAYQRLCAVTRSTVSINWLTTAAAWATRLLPHNPDGEALRIVSHRADLFEAVVEFRGSALPFFLKWSGLLPLRDPEVTRIIAAAGHVDVPRTIAWDRAAGWWLTESVRGVRLAADLSAANVERAAEVMAIVQIDALPRVQELSSIGIRRESLEDIAAEGDRILDRLAGVDAQNAHAARWAIHRACDDLRCLNLPDTWIHTDFVPENVFVEGDRVSLIDFDDPWIGPPPIAMEFLYAGIRRFTHDPSARSAALSAASDGFVRAWEMLVSPEVMRCALERSRLVAEVLRISRRLESIGTKERNGELVGFFEPAARESAARLVALANKTAR